MESPQNLEVISQEEARRILHELRVHQIELEMQNEQLRRTQEDLEISRSRYFDLYDLAPVGYCTLSAAGFILEANLNAGTLIGIHRHALVGQLLSRYVLEQDLGTFYLHRKWLFASGNPQSSELRMVNKEGTIFWVRMDASVAKGSDGEALCRLVFVDISERKHAEEEKSRLTERLNRVQKLEALGVLVAKIAHNLNNVFAAILAAASTHETQSRESDDRVAFRMIGKACKRGRDVLRSLLQFAKPALVRPEPVEVRTLVDKVVHLLKNTTMNRIEIVTDMPENELWIMGDVGGLDQSLMNLGINALDAMPEGGKLIFRSACSGLDQVELSVRDSGCGMSPEILAHVFEPFFTTKSTGKGTGLGLSTTYGVIAAHGGTLDIESEPGRGTTVTIRLPRIPAPPIREKPVEKAAPVPERLLILLVDDDEDVQFLMGAMLTKAGHHVRSADSGPAALGILRSEPLPDLVILDQNMPGMTGDQALERIRVFCPELPILISSGQPDIDTWVCFKRPNVAVIAKPFDMEEITAKLNEFVLK